jgi:hypothetical protein
MKNLAEDDSIEGFTQRVLLGMPLLLIEMRDALETLIVKYDTLAKVRDMPACSNPSIG